LEKKKASMSAHAVYRYRKLATGDLKSVS
jgi:hypothetical protein